MTPEIDAGLEPIMPYPICPYCGARQVLDATTYAGYKGMVTCHDCKGRYQIALGNAPGRLGGGGTLQSSPKPIGDPELLRGLTVPPIPLELFRDCEEAAFCLSVGASRASAVLCRYAIQRALLLNGVPESPPGRMVHVARSNKLLSETAFRQASAAVFMGGKAGHPQSDWLDNVGPEDAKQSLLCTRRILLELYHPVALG